ncbi:MAG: FG-GAP repeat protein [Alphaproteobacteria bacterium]|nr:FG-GAP repeat protein [Alphaproteobacteria bacterium]
MTVRLPSPSVLCCLALLACSDAGTDGIADTACPPEDGEICNGEDDNGNGLIDEGLLEIFWTDSDGDGFGDPYAPVQACEAGDGVVANADDCDDTDAAVYPGATELPYDGVDNDCDGADLDDVDGDGFTDDVDCDDEDPDVYPGAVEVCLDGVDNDCDGEDETCTTEGMIGVAGHGGLRAAVARDVDGDGVDDLFLGYAGATFEDDYSGGAILVKGPITANITAEDEAAVILKMDGAYGSYMGQSLGIADVDGDGDQDLIGGALAYTTDDYQAGGFFVHEATETGYVNAPVEAWAVWYGPSRSSRQGHDMDVEDHDGDGVADVLIAGYGGSDYALPTVYLVAPVAAGTHDLGVDAAAVFQGASAGDPASNIENGTRVDGGDMDGDGVHEVVMGSHVDDPSGDSSGVAWIFTGPHAGAISTADATATVNGSAAGDQMGIEVALGDFDGDGLQEAWIAALQADGDEVDAGAIYRFDASASGTLGGADATATLLGGATYDRAGLALHVRDLDQDGDDELLIGAPSQDGVEENAGAVYVFMDPPGAGVLSLSEANTIVYGGANPSDWGMENGESLGTGDLDGDGQLDLLMNARSAHATLVGHGGARAGVTWIGFGSW